MPTIRWNTIKPKRVFNKTPNVFPFILKHNLYLSHYYLWALGPWNPKRFKWVLHLIISNRYFWLWFYSWLNQWKVHWLWVWNSKVELPPHTLHLSHPQVSAATLRLMLSCHQKHRCGPSLASAVPTAQQLTVWAGVLTAVVTQSSYRDKCQRWGPAEQIKFVLANWGDVRWRIY